MRRTKSLFDDWAKELIVDEIDEREILALQKSTPEQIPSETDDEIDLLELFPPSPEKEDRQNDAPMIDVYSDTEFASIYTSGNSSDWSPLRVVPDDQKIRLKIFERAYTSARTAWPNSHEIPRHFAPFAHRPPRSDLQIHAEALIHLSLLLKDNMNELDHMTNFLTFYSFFIGNLRKFTAEEKPLRSFFGETFDIDLPEYGIKGILEQVEQDTIAMHVRGEHFVLEQHIRPKLSGRGFKGGGRITFNDCPNEIGFTFCAFIKRRNYDDTYFDTINGEIDAYSTAGYEGYLKYRHNSQEKRVTGKVWQKKYGILVQLEGEIVGESIQWIEHHGNGEIEDIGVVDPEGSASIREFVKALDKQHVLQLPITDSRLRNDTALMDCHDYDRGRDEYRRLSKAACPKSLKDSNPPVTPTHFVRRYLFRTEYFELKRFENGDYFERKEKGHLSEPYFPYPNSW